MKKRLVLIALAVVMALSCVVGLAACNGGVDGTYYAYTNGVKDESGSMTLKGGKVTMNSSEMGADVAIEGTYEVDGDTVSIKITAMGVSVTQKFTKVSNGVLKYEEHGVVQYFCKDGKTPPSDEEK